MATSSTASHWFGQEVSTILARLPTGSDLIGHHVTITRLLPSHAEYLFTIVGGEKNAPLWDYLPSGPFLSLQEFKDSISNHAASSDPFFYTILDNTTNKPVGYSALLNIVQQHRTIEVGHVLFSPLLARTRAASEAMYLLAKYVFDELGFRRYEWKCNNFNEPSKRAALRFGFKFEGIFRNHMIVKGRNRDSAWFSMLDSEWPTVKDAFERWLADGNFDEGRQIVGLRELREQGARGR